MGSFLGRGQHSGVIKVYQGQFRHDLFHGHGRLYLGTAVTQQLHKRTVADIRPGYVPHPQTDPKDRKSVV